MLFRRFPFEPNKENTDCDQRVKSMKKKIMQKPKFKKTHDNFVVSAEAIDFIKCLLVKQDRRLGYGQNGFQNVKSHKFFKDYEIQETSGSSKIGEVIRRVDWTLLLRKEVETPDIKPCLDRKNPENEIDMTKLSKYMKDSKTDNTYGGHSALNLNSFTMRPGNNSLKQRQGLELLTESFTSISENNSDSKLYTSQIMIKSTLQKSMMTNSYVKKITTSGGFWTNHTQNPLFSEHYEMDDTENTRCGKLYYRCRHKETKKDCVFKKIEKPDAYKDWTDIPTGTATSGNQIHKNCKSNDPGIMELKIMERISQDPNISHLVDLFEDEKFVYLVVENMRGGNIMKRKGLDTEKRIAGIFYKMVEVMNNLHDTGIVHGDLRPSKWAFKYSEENEDKGLHDILRLCNFQNGDFQDLNSSRSGSRRASKSSFSKTEGQKLHENDNSHQLQVKLRQNLDVNSDSGFCSENNDLKNFETKKSNDVFSMGVLLHGLLGGSEPFNISDKKIVLHGLETVELRPGLSSEAVELVLRMIDLNERERISMSEILEHTWFLKREKLPENLLPDRKVGDWEYDGYMKEMNEILGSRTSKLGKETEDVQNFESIKLEAAENEIFFNDRNKSENDVFEDSDEEKRPSSSLSATMPIFEVTGL